MKTYLKTCFLSFALIGFISCKAKNKKETIALNNSKVVLHEPSNPHIKVALLLDTRLNKF